CFGNPFVQANLVLGSYFGSHPAGRSFRFENVNINFGAVKRTYQNVVTPNDVNEAGKPDIWLLVNDGGDSLMLGSGQPPGQYGRAWVDAFDAVVIDTTTNTPGNALRPTGVNSTQAGIILRHGGFTPAEEAQIRSYWGGLYV
ncbi:hypothetical protein M3484_17335, partial [Pseudomonas sp. GX19020]|uniref:hypothetical protein n=1 Tax=Pseudomonas sp. GX19020 TaxID=2942277 RepID=UPI0020190955